jgi:hypothetical protein
MTMGERDFITSRPILAPPCDLARHAPGAPLATYGGSQYLASDLRAEIFEERGHLMPDGTGRNR